MGGSPLGIGDCGDVGLHDAFRRRRVQCLGLVSERKDHDHDHRQQCNDTHSGAENSVPRHVSTISRAALGRNG